MLTAPVMAYKKNKDFIRNLMKSEQFIFLNCKHFTQIEPRSKNNVNIHQSAFAQLFTSWTNHLTLCLTFAGKDPIMIHKGMKNENANHIYLIIYS